MYGPQQYEQDGLNGRMGGMGGFGGFGGMNQKPMQRATQFGFMGQNPSQGMQRNPMQNPGNGMLNPQSPGYSTIGDNQGQRMNQGISVSGPLPISPMMLNLRANAQNHPGLVGDRSTGDMRSMSQGVQGNPMQGNPMQGMQGLQNNPMIQQILAMLRGGSMQGNPMQGRLPQTPQFSQSLRRF